MSHPCRHWHNRAASIAGIIRDPALELVCVFVTTPDKVGQDAGALCGVEDIGTGASGDLEDVHRLKEACLSYVGSAAARELGACKEMAEFLKGGTNVVTFAVIPLINPVAAPAGLRAAIEEA